MSRIHEALKKAAEERAPVQAADVASPADSANAPSASSEITPTFAGVAANAAIVPPQAGDYLRFDDLLARCAHPQWQLAPNMNVFLDSTERSRAAEQFRTLRSHLYLLRGNGIKPLRRLLVTSAIPAEGKTFVANNLAQAIVRQPDRRVLLIDTDLRSSQLHGPLGAPSAPGLTDYLRREADEMAIIQHGREGNLCFIPAGNKVTNPSELLSNSSLTMLLDRVTPVFDWIILDSPPCLPVSDARVLAEHCDGVVFVVRAGSTPSAAAQRAHRDLQEKLVGVVLNAVEPEQAYGSYAYEYYGCGDDNSDLKSVKS